MPAIINYVNRLQAGRTFDNDEIKKLQFVYDRAREHLEIEAGDPRLETLAVLIFYVAETSTGASEIQRRAVSMFLHRY